MRVLVIDRSAERSRLTLTMLDTLGVVSWLSIAPEIDDIGAAVGEADLVIADAQLACRDNHALMVALRKAASPRWLPLIMCADRADESLRLGAMIAGVDGFLVLPVTLELLRARLDYYYNLLSTQRLADKRAERLQRYCESEEEEKELARGLLNRLISTEKLRDPALHHLVFPASTFSGDAIVAARTPAGVLHVLLADCTGHGLAAALGVLPVCAPFYRMTERGFAIDAIAREMNARVRELLPVERFIAATLVAVDSQNRLVQVWTAGNPLPALIHADGCFSRPFVSRHLPLGICDDAEFDSSLDVVPVNSDDRVLLYSDGAIEAESPRGRAFGEFGFERALLDWDGTDCFFHLVLALNRHLDMRPAADDVSIALIDCGIMAPAREGIAAAMTAS